MDELSIIISISIPVKPKHLVTSYRAISLLPTLGITPQINYFPNQPNKKSYQIINSFEEKKHFTNVFLDNIYTNLVAPQRPK